MKLGVFLPGRLKSERLPNKLILPLGDSCLWEIACRKLNQLPERYSKYVLCNDNELIEIAEKYENIKIIRRSPETCTAEGPLNFIFKELADVPDTHLMFLNPCLSMLTVETIIKSLEYFETHDGDYATSVKKLQNWIFDSDMSKPINHIDYERLTTKEIIPLWQTAHCFHIFNVDKFFEDGMMLKPGHLLLPVPEEETADVDTFHDLMFARMLHAKTYVVDIDGTICITQGTAYHESKPIQENIDRINRLYDAGNTICYQTARGYVSRKDLRGLTEKQLQSWGVKYHKLLFGKAAADIYIDDKGVNINDFMRGKQQL